MRQRWRWVGLRSVKSVQFWSEQEVGMEWRRGIEKSCGAANELSDGQESKRREVGGECKGSARDAKGSPLC